MNASKGLLVTLLAWLTLGCTPAAKIMTFEMPQAPRENRLVWPDPPAPARIVYIGDLIGENNFISAADDVKSGFRSFLEVLAGVGLDEPEPKVLRRPQSGVTGPDGRIYVTDVGSSAVFVFDEAQGTMDIWYSLTDKVNYVAPTGIALAPEGRLLVADSELGEVFVLDSQSGELQSRFGAGVLKRPTGVVVAPEYQLVFVADTRAHDVKVFDFDGNLIDSIGQQGDGVGEFNAPVYMSYRDGKLFIADVLNARVQVVGIEGRVFNVIGERGLYVGNLTRPKGVALDSDGNLYVVESYYDHLLVFNQQGRLLLPIGGPGFSSGRFYLPSGVWTDARDRIYVADMMNGRISIFQYLGNPG
ncbi:hypothetical protein [Motiliproteus sediminis]|uniref:hypothetical protein n=1 Tax=Motiliproteus sediminis TaxID=1468178 RepID=UPI001AF01FE0|nr:hypothetical protein [Motiliproteus sediminis]